VREPRGFPSRPSFLLPFRRCSGKLSIFSFHEIYYSCVVNFNTPPSLSFGHWSVIFYYWYSFVAFLPSCSYWESWEPQPPVLLGAYLGLYRDSFTLTYCSLLLRFIGICEIVISIFDHVGVATEVLTSLWELPRSCFGQVIGYPVWGVSWQFLVSPDKRGDGTCNTHDSCLPHIL
jgi:hypothetical protein